jgi:hypothetical protein
MNDISMYRKKQNGSYYTRARFILTSLGALQPIPVIFPHANESCILSCIKFFPQATFQTLKQRIKLRLQNRDARPKGYMLGPPPKLKFKIKNIL